MARSISVKFILPSLIEAKTPYWRPVKYALFPPLGLATLAAYLRPDDQAEIIDQHVEPLDLNGRPDLVVIQTYITNANRAYQIADHYRQQGVFVALGGLHVTSLPEEATQHTDAIFLGPGEDTFPKFLEEFRENRPRKRYQSKIRTLDNLPAIRRDSIKRENYLVPNSIVVSRGCPHHCSFCYKDAFFKGGKSYYNQRVDQALAEIERLPGRHLYFLDDHLFANPRFGHQLFHEMEGMNRLFQGAATVESILKGDLVEQAVKAGLRSIFIGFESINHNSLGSYSKRHNQYASYEQAISRLRELGVMINGSFVFGLDGDGPDVFRRTVDWAIDQGLTTSTFHIATPYPGTQFFEQMKKSGRILHYNWDKYDTRQVICRPKNMSIEQLQNGYAWSYENFYRWSAIARSSMNQASIKNQFKHFAYTAAWKKLEPLWGFIINNRRIAQMRPLLEKVLSTTRPKNSQTGSLPSHESQTPV